MILHFCYFFSFCYPVVTKIVKEVGQQAPIYPKILRQKK